jgi:hypothetical protein
MSGGQTPRHDSYKPLKYISNLIPVTTCRYHMPYVVAYVVGHVEGAAVYSSLAKGLDKTRRGFWHSERSSFLVYCLHEELCRPVGRIHHDERHLPDERPSRARAAMLCRLSRVRRSSFGSSGLPKIPGEGKAEWKGLTDGHFSCGACPHPTSERWTGGRILTRSGRERFQADCSGTLGTLWYCVPRRKLVHLKQLPASPARNTTARN